MNKRAPSPLVVKIGRVTRMPNRLRKRDTYHHGNLRDALIAAGIFLLDTQGADALSLRGAARLAGVSPAAPGHHFQDKRGMLAAIATKGFEQLTAKRLEMLAMDMSAEERLRALMLGYVLFAIERPALFNLMFGSELADKEGYEELRTASIASFRLLMHAIADHLQAHKLPAGYAEAAAVHVWSATHGLSTLLVHRQQNPRQKLQATEQCRALANVLIAGLGADAKVNVR
jgi:AcrR family transcriptional regulator